MKMFLVNGKAEYAKTLEDFKNFLEPSIYEAISEIVTEEKEEMEYRYKDEIEYLEFKIDELEDELSNYL